MNSVPPCYVLTRTSERPLFFSQNHTSVMSQTYPNVVHVVSYDTEDTGKYLEQYPDLKIVPVIRQERLKNAHFPYNLYCNQMHKTITADGWVLYLDDDDLFTRTDALSVISQYFNSSDNLIVWKVQFPYGIEPSNRYFKRSVKQSGFPAICFCFHTKWLRYAIWDDMKGSDSRVARALSKVIPKVIWVDDVLTKINYTEGSGGYGRRVDQKSC